MRRSFLQFDNSDTIAVIKRNTTFMVWLFASLLPILLYYLGAFSTQISLIDKPDRTKIDAIIEGVITPELDVVQNKLISICDVTEITNVNICGLNYSLGNALDDGIDLSDYKTLTFTISATGPVDSHSVRFQLRNFNPNYSTVSDPMSLKYQGMTIDTFEDEITYTVNLNDFHVESWWLFSYHLGMKDAVADFTNVSEVIVIHNGIDIPGRYTIELQDVSAKGDLVKLSTVVSMTMATWLCIMIIGLIRYDRAIKQRLHTDPLTQIKNRNGLTAFLKKHVKYNQNKPHLGLVYIDLDNFKRINDTYGHDAGDKVLQTFATETSNLLKHSMASPSKYCFVRMSGDEFALLIRTRHKSTINHIAEKIHQQFEAPISFAGESIELGFSIGVAFEEVFDDKATQLFAHADAAMYEAKSSGKSTSRTYDNDLHNCQKLARVSINAFKTEFHNDQSPWTFVPFFHLKQKTLDIVEIQLSSKHYVVIAEVLKQIPNESQKRQAAEQIGLFVFGQFEAFYQLQASWFFEQKIKVIFNYPDVYSFSIALSEKCARAICESNINNPLLSVAFNSANAQGTWKQLKEMQYQLNADHVQITPTGFMQSGADLKLIEDFSVNTVCFSNEYMEKHFAEGELSEQFILFNQYLKSYGIVSICDGYACDLEKMVMLESANIEYVLGFLMEPTSNISELKRLHEINKDHLAD